jgi:glycosyltransferase involved in cell wall biosynthesis
MKLLMIINEDRFFLSHRKDIAITAQNQGWDVIVVCKNTGRRKEVEDLGLKMLEMPINPTGTNLLQELRTFFFLFNLYRKNKDAIVHHVGLKSILWGGLAAKLTGVKGVVDAVSGLGVIFSEDSSSLIAKAILLLLRFTHNRKRTRVIFQNDEDKELFLHHHIIKKENTVYIKGSGVNLEEYPYTPQPESDTVKILFTARMVKEKGVIVLIEAAEQLREKYQRKAEFWLCGGLSRNPKALKEEDLKQLCDGSYIQWFGYRSDVLRLLQQSHIMAFPSYYREGVPRSLIEACAIGRPIVTTDSIGCRDTVDDGVNGFLVPVKNSTVLAEKLQQLIDDSQLRATMGKASREKAVREFSVGKVVDKHLQLYNRLFAAKL